MAPKVIPAAAPRRVNWFISDMNERSPSRDVPAKVMARVRKATRVKLMASRTRPPFTPQLARRLSSSAPTRPAPPAKEAVARVIAGTNNMGEMGTKPCWTMIIPAMRPKTAPAPALTRKGLLSSLGVRDLGLDIILHFSYEVFPHGIEGRLGAALDIQLLQDVGHMGF